MINFLKLYQKFDDIISYLFSNTVNSYGGDTNLDGYIDILDFLWFSRFRFFNGFGEILRVFIH